VKQLRVMVSLRPLVFLPLLALPARATVHQYVEDFTTKAYCDTVNTSANWNTPAGEINLHPFEMTLVGGCDTPGYAGCVAIAGDYAYVADYGSGLQVVDISDPTSPIAAGSCDTPGDARAVAIAGDYAYVADGNSGLQVIDISDPANPVSAGGCDTPGYAWAVGIAGDHAYVADGDAGLQLLDITDPTSPAPAGSYDTPGDARGIATAGDHAYVADEDSGLQVLDISDSANPVLAGSCDTPGWALGVALAGDYAYVADYHHGSEVIDISDPTNPVLAGSCDAPGYAYGVSVAGDYAYVAAHDIGLHVLDISDPTNPVLAGSCDTPGWALGVSLAGDYAYVADVESGLQVVDISDPIDPVFAGSCDTPHHAGEVAIAGDYAYVADDTTGLQVIDISDPMNPVLAGSCDTPGWATGVALAGDYAYLAEGGDYGLHVVDISDPANPVPVGDCYTPGHPVDVAIAGDHAYAAGGGFGLLVVDISDPTNPSFVVSYATSGYARGVAIDGDCAYVVDEHYGLSVIDISDPADPVFAGGYGTPEGAWNVAVAGDYAYVADGYSGLVVVDISDPTDPVLAGSCDTPGHAVEVAIAGDHAYVAEGGIGGLQVLDISDPTNPLLAGNCDTPGYALSVVIAGDYAYVPGGGFGLQVIEVFQRALNCDANIGRSLDVEPAGDEVIRARLNSTQTDSVRWELTVDSGAHWDDVLPGGGWHEFAWSGSDLQWRSNHFYTGGEVNPGCSDLTIDWLYEFPVVESVVDVGNDQGRQVSIQWTRSGYDFVGSSTPITEYAVYRRIDEAASETPSRSAGSDIEPRPCLSEPGHGVLYPPGSWHFIVTVPASAEEEYAIVSPTLVDSTIVGGMHYSVFFVRALTATPGVHFDAPPDSGYSVDNLAPGVPQGFAIDYSANENQLVWEESDDEDFQHFRVYRSTDPEFVPDPGNLVHMTIDTGWIDSVTEGWQYHYKVSAVDFSGNESDPASPGTVTGADELPVPGRYALYQNVPNPLGPTTVIRYDVPAGDGKVTLEIFDVSGRLVRRLLDGHEAPGRKAVAWDGRNEHGERVGSGVYYYRLEAPGYERTLRLMVVK
jgi:hypothetical protein